MTGYDPEARRDTPLAQRLRERIGRGGPIPISDYMRSCLLDPEHGYYTRRPAIGASGDFVTAPEVSQIFGELIGLWCVVAWQQMGSPARVRLVELGPGRGTLMADLLRAARVVPAFLAAAEVTMVETSAVMAECQRAALTGAGVPIRWSGAIEPGTGGATIIVGNEFVDTIPITQHVLVDGDWIERVVEVDGNGRLAYGLDHRARIPDQQRLEAHDGDVMEGRSLTPLLLDIAAAAHAPLAALLIDYGHARSAPGDTLQAVRSHSYEHPLTSPGEADLTSQVDFQELAERAAAAGLAVAGTVTQAELLGALGITQRASRLMSANPALAGGIEAGVARLMSPTGMGTRFKAIGLRSHGMPVLPGFPIDRC